MGGVKGGGDGGGAAVAVERTQFGRGGFRVAAPTRRRYKSACKWERAQVSKRERVPVEVLEGMTHVARFATEVLGLAQPTDVDFLTDIDDVGSTGCAGPTAGRCRSCSSGWIVEEEGILVSDVGILVAFRQGRRGDSCTGFRSGERSAHRAWVR